MSAPLVVGLDLSITATGIAWADGTTSTTGGPAKVGDHRLLSIVHAVRGACNITDCLVQRGPDLVVIEDIPTHAHGAGVTAMVHGAVRAELLRAEDPYVLVPPATLKKYATGRGNATKAGMAVALYRRFGLELADDNQVDSFLLRAAGLHAMGHPIFDVPKAQSDALAKVQWPVPNIYDGGSK
jgi:Holliday junction resolvasome RuvABC endonuclease subunit